MSASSHQLAAVARPSCAGLARSGDVVAGRYVLLGVLGESPGGAAFRARDRWYDREVSLRMLRDDAEAADEFAAALEAQHPGFARALDFGRVAGLPFVVTERVEGDEPSRAIRSGDVETVAIVLDQLLGSLGFLHARGLSYGALRAASIRVAERDGRTRARFVDPASVRTTGAAVDPRADLAALGAMARAWLAPRGAIALPAHVPAALGELLARLGERDPHAAFASALDARAALHEAVALPADAHVVDLGEVAPALCERAAPLALLAAAAERARDGRTSRTRIQGGAGTGRSRLLHRAACDATVAGMAVLTARPNDARLGLLRQLVERIAALGLAGAAGTRALAAVAAYASGDGPRGAALLGALDALQAAAQRVPLWIGLDDFDAADDESRDAIGFLARGHDAAAIAWVVVGAPRGRARDELGDDVTQVAIGALTARGVHALVGSMTAGLVELDALARTAWARTGGRPDAVCDGVRELQRRGALRAAGGRWRLLAEPRVLDEVFAASDEARARRAVEHVADAHRAVLGAAAVAGTAFTPRELARIADATLQLAAAAVHAGVAAGVVRAADDGSPTPAVQRPDDPARARLSGEFPAAFLERSYALAGPAVAGALASLLPDAEARAVHARALAALGCATGLAAHADHYRHAQALGRAREAGDGALAAARASVAQGAAVAAARWFARARAFGADSLTAALQHGDALADAGELAQAQTAWAQALALGAAAGDVALHRGRALARAGRDADALAALAQVDGGSAEVRSLRAWSLARTGRHDEALALAEPRADDGAVARAWLARAASAALLAQGRTDEARAVLIAARTGLDRSVLGVDAAARTELERALGEALARGGELDAAAATYRGAVQRYSDAGDVAAAMRCAHDAGEALYRAGRWDAAHAHWTQAADLAARLGDAGAHAGANTRLGVLWQERGELEQARPLLEHAAALAHEAERPELEADALAALGEVLALAGQTDRADKAMSRCEALASAHDARIGCVRRRALLALARGDGGTALALAKCAAEAALGHDEPGERGAALLLGAAAARATGALETARALVREARSVLESRTRIERAHALLEDARVRAAGGDMRAARALAGEAATAFAEVGAARPLGAARALERGTVSGRGVLALELAEALGDSRGSAEQLLERVLDRLLAATGAERGLVLLLDDEQGPRVAALRELTGLDAPLPRLSAATAERVVAQRRPMVISEAGAPHAAVAAPLVRDERCLGILYLETTHAAGDRAQAWIAALETASAVVAPALELLLAHERERERARVLRETAEGLIESLSVIDAALDLVAEEDDPAQRAALSQRARGRCGSLLARADAVLELLRPAGDAVDTAAPPRADDVGVDVGALLRYVVAARLDAGASSPVVLDLPPDAARLPRVRGETEALVRTFAQLVEAASGERTAAVTVRAFACDDDGHGAVLGWRPGAPDAARGRRVRVALACNTTALDGLAELAVRTARRALARWGVAVWTEFDAPRDEADPGAARIVVDFCPWTAARARATPTAAAPREVVR